jgi:hypothetical protein
MYDFEAKGIAFGVRLGRVNLTRLQKFNKARRRSRGIVDYSAKDEEFVRSKYRMKSGVDERQRFHGRWCIKMGKYLNQDAIRGIKER